MSFSRLVLAATVATFCSTIFSLQASALVDMKNANYADSWIDITLPGAGYALRVQRTYNSRSVYNGMFGFGWCSEFETKMEKTPEGRLKVTECGAGQEIIYSPGSKTDKVALDKTVDSIVAYYKKTNPAATAPAVETFRDQLKDYADLRIKWAKTAGITIPDVKKGQVYSADNLEVEQMTFDGAVYTRSLADGTSQKFDTSGKMTAAYDKSGNFLKLSYTGDSLKDVTDNNGRRLSFSMTPTHRVKEIVAPGNIKVEYKYKGEDLVEIKNMWKNTYTYEYDETHNLTKINFPDKTFKALTYDQKNDWVLSFTDRVIAGAKCVETYKYEVDKNSPRDHFTSGATKKCGTEVKNESHFEFWHKARADGSKYLARVLTRSLSETLDVSYHPQFGRPISVKKNNQTTTFDYYANGLLKEKATTSMRLSYEYANKYNKVSKVHTEFFDQKGKVAKKRETKFEYDDRARLYTAQNSDGQAVVLGYNSKGLIKSIVDQAKKEIVIEYDEKTGKPSSLTRPNVGKVNLVYNAAGEVTLKSDESGSAATQIAASFNNLLEIIAPATSELNL
jgi:YD repeat-containing protein